MPRPEMRKCRRCGRLFSGAPDQPMCATCAKLNLEAALKVDEAVDREGCTTIDAIVESTGLAPAEVLQIVRDTSALRSRVDTGDICLRCRNAPAHPGSRYCPDCRATLARGFDTATTRLLERIAAMTARGELPEVSTDQTPQTSPASLRLSVAQALNRKRQLTRTARFDPTPHTKYSD